MDRGRVCPRPQWGGRTRLEWGLLSSGHFKPSPASGHVLQDPAWELPGKWTGEGRGQGYGNPFPIPDPGTTSGARLRHILC